MGDASYIRLEQGGGPIFEVAILCISNIREALKAVQIVRDLVG